MWDVFQSTWFFGLVRAVHFGSCLLAFGAVAFDRWIAALALNGRQVYAGMVRMLWLSVILALTSGVLWLWLTTIDMSGLSAQESLQWDVLRVVISETHFGKLWAYRFDLWLAMFAGMLLLFVRPLRAAATWLVLALSGAFAASLAWAGHGLDGKNAQWHLLADAIHILVGGVWPAGLLPFTILFLKLRRSTDAGKWIAIAHLVRRFSAASLISVSILAATGLVNSLYMLDAWSDLIRADYGRILLAKIAAFGVMVALGAMNLLRWKPRLSAEYDDRTPAAAARLQLSVAVEVVLSLAVLVLVGFLGITMPPMSGMAHNHH